MELIQNVYFIEHFIHKERRTETSQEGFYINATHGDTKLHSTHQYSAARSDNGNCTRMETYIRQLCETRRMFLPRFQYTRSIRIDYTAMRPACYDVSSVVARNKSTGIEKAVENINWLQDSHLHTIHYCFIMSTQWIANRNYNGNVVISWDVTLSLIWINVRKKTMGLLTERSSWNLQSSGMEFPMIGKCVQCNKNMRSCPPPLTTSSSQLRTRQ
jgi:hypothetical protein